MKLAQRTLDIYRRHLSRFVVFRLCKASLLAGLRSAHRVRSRILRAHFSGLYSWLALSETEGYTTVRSRLAPGEIVQIPAPAFMGHGAEKASFRTPARHQPSPEMEVFEFPKAVTVGGMDFFFLDDKAVHHDLFVPGEHRCPAENVGVVSQAASGIALHLTKDLLETESAVSLIGQCSGNYAHWLTETLPKLAILDASGCFGNSPLLVDAGLHPNILASIDLINFNGRPVVQIPRWTPMRVNRLIAISTPGYERYAPHAFSGGEPPPYVNMFSRAALGALRQAVLRGLGDSKPDMPRKIYLSRSGGSSNLRQIENTDEIENALNLAGVPSVQPGSMSFREQVEACRDARVIVGPVGASLANMIFAPTGCRVVCLAPYYDEASYFYYTNLAGVLGHHIHFILGAQTCTALHPMHRNYVIPAELLMTAIAD